VTSFRDSVGFVNSEANFFGFSNSMSLLFWVKSWAVDGLPFSSGELSNFYGVFACWVRRADLSASVGVPDATFSGTLAI
jgi:hypothetical protein